MGLKDMPEIVEDGLDGYEAQYLTYLGTQRNMALSFGCRRSDQNCLFFGANHMWIKAEEHEWYWCPMCKFKYEPWRESEILAPYQKIFVLKDLKGKVRDETC